MYMLTADIYSHRHWTSYSLSSLWMDILCLCAGSDGISEGSAGCCAESKRDSGTKVHCPTTYAGKAHKSKKNHVCWIIGTHFHCTISGLLWFSSFQLNTQFFQFSKDCLENILVLHAVSIFTIMQPSSVQLNKNTIAQRFLIDSVWQI